MARKKSDHLAIRSASFNINHGISTLFSMQVL